MRLTEDKFANVDWQKMNDLVPCVVQENSSGMVLMLGYMSKESAAKTVESGFVTFFSRSKQRLWQKGETSGNTLEVVDIHCDCDQDAILIRANANGPTCHLGSSSCFGESHTDSIGFLKHLDKTIVSRSEADSESSYTASLFKQGISRMAQKVGEEGVEVALAAKDEGKVDLVNESADLIFHLMVLLRAKGSSLDEAVGVLARRNSAVR